MHGTKRHAVSASLAYITAYAGFPVPDPSMESIFVALLGELPNGRKLTYRASTAVTVPCR